MSLRVLLALGGTAVAGPMAAVLLAWAWQPAPLPYPHALLKAGLPKAAPPAVLAAAGRPTFRLSDLAGRTVWLYLGYASCPDVCPNALGFLAEEHGRLAHPERVRVVFVSVDPLRDPPAVLARYVAFFDPSFIGATGSRDQIDGLVGALGASYVAERPKLPGGSYAISHSNLVYVIDPAGELVGSYVPGQAVGELAQDSELQASRWTSP